MRVSHLIITQYASTSVEFTLNVKRINVSFIVVIRIGINVEVNQITHEKNILFYLNMCDDDINNKANIGEH